MTDFGTPQERKDALRIALACKELNDAIGAAPFFVRVIDLRSGEPEKCSQMQVDCMERRTMILPCSVVSAPGESS